MSFNSYLTLPHVLLKHPVCCGSHNAFRDSHPGNDQFASCGGDRAVFFWDVSTGKVIRRIRGHEAVSFVMFLTISYLNLSVSLQPLNDCDLVSLSTTIEDAFVLQ
jgi:WD40 repeat protein